MSRHARTATGRSSSLALVVCLVLSYSGCRARSAEDFVPSADLARSAMAASLEAWQSGRSQVAPIGGSEAQISVELVDNFRAPGRALVGFEILGEAPATNARGFVVRLKLTNPPEELKCRYVVLGIDPLWVFRQEDYDMLAHWDHAMPDEVAEQPGEAGRNP